MLELAHVLTGVQMDPAGHPCVIPQQWQQISISDIVTDSRLACTDTLFVALAGQRTDGHYFLRDVAERGARGALVTCDALHQWQSTLDTIQRPWVVIDALRYQDSHGFDTLCHTPPDSEVFVLIGVDDPLKALQRFAFYHRSLHTPTVVGITGSVGKTSTKEVTAAVVGRRFRTLKNKKSYNSEITVPTTLLELTASHEVAVVEMGMWAPGEIRFLATLARPHIGIVTNVGPSHLERMGSMEAIINAKAELVEALPADGIAILNADDENVITMAHRTHARVVSYGFSPSADVWVSDLVSCGLKGTTCRFHYRDESYQIHMPFPGKHHVYTALAAVTTGVVLGVSWDNIIAGLQDTAIHTRVQIYQVTTESGTYTVIDDTYNASPQSSLAALALLAECQGRRIVVLGDMLELGPFAEQGHRMVGRQVAAIAQRFIGVGNQVAWVAQEAQACGMAYDHITLFEQGNLAIPMVQSLVKDGDYVLVKGSRNVAMEHIVTALTETNLRTSPHTVGDCSTLQEVV